MKTMAFRKRKHKGVILVMLLVMITVFGFYMAVLAGISNQLIAETNEAYLSACKKNMTKSAMAFSIHNPDMPTNKAIELNIAEMGRSCKFLTITQKTEPGPMLEIGGECQFARRKISIKETIKIIEKTTVDDSAGE